MPKTTKTSRKPSIPSTKKSGFKRRFDITNKKVQFFVVIGIVAVLGGGYFTIKSFANTLASWQSQNGGLKCVPVEKECQPLSEAQKGSSTVLGFTKGGSARTSSSFAQTSGRKYNYCITGKGIGTMTVSADNLLNGSQRISFNNTGGYERKCVLVTASRSQTTPMLLHHAININDKSQKLVTVSILEIEQAQLPISTSGGGK